MPVHVITGLASCEELRQASPFVPLHSLPNPYPTHTHGAIRHPISVADFLYQPIPSYLSHLVGWCGAKNSPVLCAILTGLRLRLPWEPGATTSLTASCMGSFTHWSSIRYFCPTVSDNWRCTVIHCTSITTLVL